MNDDNTTMWVSGATTPLLYRPPSERYPIKGGVFQIDVATGRISKADGYRDVRDSRGLWSDGTFMWVVSNGDKKLQAYTLDGGRHVEQGDIALGDMSDPMGVWSDGDVIWVADAGGHTIKSFRLTPASN